MSNEGLTPQDLAILKRPFELHEHKFVKGLAYLPEQSIANRIEEIDTAWEFKIISLTTRTSAGDGGKEVATAVCVGELTIKGITRGNSGMDTVQQTNVIKKNGDEYTNEANEAEKSATTDCFKRCARLFGIGRYLLDCKVKSDNEFKRWLGNLTGNTIGNEEIKSEPKKAPRPQPQRQQSGGNGEITITEVETKYSDKKKKPYMVAQGITLWTTAPFKLLEIDVSDFATVKTHKLPVELKLGYEMEGNYRHALYLQRDDVRVVTDGKDWHIES